MVHTGKNDEQALEHQLRHGGVANGVHMEIADIGASLIWVVDRSEEYLATLKPEYRGGRILIRVVERGPDRWQVTSLVTGKVLGEFSTRDDALRYGRAHIFLDEEGEQGVEP